MTPEEILLSSIAPLQRSVSQYGDAQIALAMRERARAEQQMDAAQRHQQALALLGVQQQNAMAVRKAQDQALMERQKQQDQAMMDRGMAFLGERELSQDVDEVEARNRERDSLYETAAAYGFKLDPNLEPEENQRKATKVLEDKAVEGYRNLVGERTKIKDEIDELLTPRTASDAAVAKALAQDPIVVGMLDKNQLTALQAGKVEEATKKLSKGERESFMIQAQAVREKLETALNTEHQRKAMVKARELSNRHDELSTAIGAAQKAIPSHRLGEAYTGGSKSDEPKKVGGKEAFAEELKKLLGGGQSALPAPPSAAASKTPYVPPAMFLQPGGIAPEMFGTTLQAPVLPPYIPSPLVAPQAPDASGAFGIPQLTDEEAKRLLIGPPMPRAPVPIGTLPPSMFLRPRQ